MKTRFNHDVRKKCVIVNASELGRLRLLLLHFFASIMSTPFHAISRIILRCTSLTTQRRSLNWKQKRLELVRMMIFLLCYPRMERFKNSASMAWKLVLECITHPDVFCNWEKQNDLWDGGNCRTILTKWPMGMSENWWYTTHWTVQGPVVGRKVGIDDNGSKKPNERMG